MAPRFLFPERRAGINPEAFLMADAGLLAMARRYHAAADYARVEQSCRQVLADDPHQAEPGACWRRPACCRGGSARRPTPTGGPCTWGPPRPRPTTTWASPWRG